MTIAEAMAQAIRYHQAGALRQAEQIYREILRLQPQHAGALHFLGVLAYQAGKNDLALDYIRRAIALSPEVAAFHCNMALVHDAMGNLEEAEACDRRALQLQPDCPEAHMHLGNLRQQQGRWDEALVCYREALRFKPDFAAAHSNLGNVLLQQNRLEAAVASYREALRIDPGLADACKNLGNAHDKRGRWEQAAACYQEAVRLKPDFVDAHNDLGKTLRHLGKFDEAIASCQRALRLQPHFSAAHNNLGNAYRSLGKLDEAVASYQQALRQDPANAGALNNLGKTLQVRGQLDGAAACFDQALRVDPQMADAHRNRSLLWLLRGDFARGWAEYEWRWRREELAPRRLPQPLWDGSPGPGQTILLVGEQGFGDALQFIRYAPLVKERVGRVAFECPAPLLPLLGSCAGIDQLVEAGTPLPDFDLQAPLLSLPRIFRTDAASVPAAVPYLQPDPARVARWADKLRTIVGFKIGIAWQGNPTYLEDRYRSLPLTHFEPLAGIEGVHLLSLQKDFGREQLAALGGRFPVIDLGATLDETGGAFMDTAALMTQLDLVITSDTALPHLAGALAVPVWVALSLVPDWRWLLDREDCPWYPTMRLFRQAELNNWGEVFRRMASEVRILLTAPASP